ncbi:hypothetical protein P8605_18625 [Streptomyces sp. T-3]|nr:hypothetical protein [Streptomyces sp. T-3]
MDADQTSERRWRSDINVLKGWETDKCLELIGITADQMNTRPLSLACAAAVVLAQRDEPELPDDTWRELTVGELDMADQLDPTDEADPTSPPSGGGSSSPTPSASLPER